MCMRVSTNHRACKFATWSIVTCAHAWVHNCCPKSHARNSWHDRFACVHESDSFNYWAGHGPMAQMYNTALCSMHQHSWAAVIRPRWMILLLGTISEWSWSWKLITCIFLQHIISNQWCAWLTLQGCSFDRMNHSIRTDQWYISETSLTITDAVCTDLKGFPSR